MINNSTSSKPLLSATIYEGCLYHSFSSGELRIEKSHIFTMPTIYWFKVSSIRYGWKLLSNLSGAVRFSISITQFTYL